MQWYHPENACRVIKDNGGLDLVDYLLMRGITAALLDILSCNYTGERMHLKMIAESEPVHCDSHMVEDDAGLIEEVDVDAGTVLVNTIILTIFFYFSFFLFANLHGTMPALDISFRTKYPGLIYSKHD